MPNLDAHMVRQILYEVLNHLPKGYVSGITSVGSSAYCGPYIAQVKLEHGEIWLRKTTQNRVDGLKRISLADPKCFDIIADFIRELEDGS
jgi:hypothetical protein